MDNDFAIKVEKLSKRYRIGLKEKRHDTFGGAIASWFKSPFTNWKQLRELSSFSNNDEKDIIWAVKDVSFEVKEGEAVGIIGPNGAGKSTLLKIISRITEPTSGEVIFNGRVSSLLEVGTGFHSELTGRENIYLNGTILGMSKNEIDRKFDEIVSFSGIEKFIDTPVKRYSSGMSVRLAFSVAAHLEPEILLIDEVLAVGDAKFQKKCIGKMDEVAKKGRTVLFVSHNMTAISTLCSKIVYLNGGRVVFLGSTEKGIEKYLLEMSDGNVCDGDIEQRKQRFGPAAFSKLISIQTVDGKDHVTSRFEMGATLKVRLKFRLTDEIDNLEIGWSAFSTMGAKLQTFVGNWEGMPTKFGPGTHSVICEVQRINLFPGLFRITPWIKREGENVDDQVPMAIEFEVIGANVTGHNQYFYRYPHSGVFQRSLWTIE